MLLFPSFIQLNITNRCNLQCKHCNNNSGKSLENELSDVEIFELLDYFLSKQIVCITFGGGEPLVHPRIFDFIEYAIERWGRITLLSNGKAITREIAEKLHRSGVARIRISLDGSSAEINDFIRGEGSFDYAIKALGYLRDTGLQDIAVMTSVNLFNVDDVENIIQLLIDIGIRDIKLIPTISSGRAKKEFSEYVFRGNFMKMLINKKDELVTKYGASMHVSIDTPLEAITVENNPEKLQRLGPCIIGQVFLGIRANGDIFACPMLDEVIIGNVRKDDIQKIWLRSNILNDVRGIEKLKGKCRTCRLRETCGGWCRAMSYLYNNDILTPDPYCWLYETVNR